MRRLFFRCGAVLAVLACTPLAAQVRGTVVDAAGRPVADAAVNLWAGREELGQTRSDAAGAFVVGQAAAQRPTSLSVRRLGMRTVIVELASADTTVTVRMEVQPVPLAPIQATSIRRLCPNRESPAARALWARMAANYWQPGGTDSIPLFGLSEDQTARVPRERIGAADIARAEPHWVYTWRTTAREAFSDRIIARAGYAARVTGGGMGERTAFWHYHILESWDAQHWTRDTFAARHTLALVSATPERTVISFCPRERLGEFGQVQGTLTIHPDGTLAAATWRFRTSAPDEDAGAEAEYLPPDPALRRALLARRTLFWRKTTLNRYYVEARHFSGWRVLDGTFDPAEVGSAPRPPRQH